MTSTTAIQAVFFDLGGTLVELQFDPASTFTGLLELEGARDALDRLRGHCQLGIISNTGDIAPAAIREALAELRLLDYFDAELVLFSGEVGMDKSAPQIFRLAVARAGDVTHPARCLYVRDDADERRSARRAGLSTRRSPATAARAVVGDGAPPVDGSGPPPAVPDLSNLAACIADARDAGRDAGAGPADPVDYAQLLSRLDAATAKLPPVYRESVGQPFRAELLRIGAAGFARILAQDPRREGSARLMLDIAQSILQNGEDFEPISTDAFEEVVSDLYDGFLGAEVRSGLKLPDHRVLAPLVKWGEPQAGPYTWPIDATGVFKCQAAVVSLPPANARRGLFAWTALGHETAGHDIQAADDGLATELAQRLLAALQADPSVASLATYWSQRIDETASDVMGILNMGPAAGIGLIAYFRGLGAAFGGEPKLRNDGPASDPHPADILRGFVAASTVRLLSFDGAPQWARAIEDETMKDVTHIRIENVPVSVDKARRSCDIVANVIAATRMDTLNGHAMIEIQNWRNEDEAICRELQRSILTMTPIDADKAHGVYAAHVVAAAATAALSQAGATGIGPIFRGMIAVLKSMHDANAAWGPLFVAHPGAIARDLVYVRTLERLAG